MVLEISEEKWINVLFEAKAIEEISKKRTELNISSIDDFVPVETIKSGNLTDEDFYTATKAWDISEDTAERIMDIYYPSVERQLEQLEKHNSRLSPRLVNKVYLSTLENIFDPFIKVEEMSFDKRNYGFTLYKILNSTTKSFFNKIRHQTQKKKMVNLQVEYYSINFSYNDPMVLQVAGDTILKLNDFFKKYGYEFESECQYETLDIKF